MNNISYVPASDSKVAGAFGSLDKMSFVPASIEGIISSCYNQRVPPKNKFSVTWWEDTSMFQYNALLVSAFYGIKTPNYRDYYGIPRKGFTLYGDSGGFQVANVDGASMNPINLSRWYNENVDKGFILDTPIVKNGIEYDDKMFDIALKRTYKDTEIMMKYCNIPLYGILHGHNQKQLEKWWKHIGDFSFDAWCGGAKPPSDPMLQALMCMQLKELGIKNIHLLGVSGFSVTPVLAYASKYFNFITYDSGSYGVGAMYRNYILPHDINTKINFGRDNKNHLMELPCDCEVCRNVTPEQLYIENSLGGALISLHNLIVYIKYNKMMKSIVADRENFKEYVKNSFKPAVFKALEFIDYTVENGLDKGYQKYFEDNSTISRPLFEE